MDYHDVIVIEQGTTYDPIYSALKVIFPFPNPANITAGNNFKFNAAQNDGLNSTFNWQVNGIAGGNSTVGTIDGNGLYTAPSSIPSGGKVTIKAVSKDDGTASAQVDVNVTSAIGIPWTEAFASDTVGKLPETWQVVDGNGDWKVDSDAGTKVLHNYNMSEGRVEQFQTGVGGNLSGALHEPMLVGGNANWTDYNYSVSVKSLKTPYVWFGINSEKVDTYAGLVFRYKDSSNYYVYRWAQDNNLRLYKKVNGIETVIGSPQSVPFLPTGSYTNLSVNVNGQSFTAYVNGVAVRSDTDNSITKGSIGLISNLMENDFKNISVNTASNPVIVPGGNYVVNTGFESGAINPWTTNGTAAAVNSNAHSGTYAGTITVAGNNLEQTLTGLSPNTTYILAGWGKAPSGGVVQIGVKNFGGTEAFQQVSSTGYTQAQVTFKTGATNTTALIYAWEPGGTNYTVYADDFTVRLPLVNNAGFETGAISPWTTNGTAAAVNSNAHSGTYAGTITVAGNNLEQTITGLSPNTTYTLTGWGKAPSGGVVQIGVKNFGGTEAFQQISSAGYTQVQVTFTTGAASTSALIYAWEPNGTSYTVYTDDLNIN